MRNTKVIMLCTLFLVLYSAPSTFAAEYDNGRALHKLSTAKTYFDVNMGVADKLVTRLKMIDATYRQLAAVNIRPEFVIGFRGKATRYVTRGEYYILEEDLAAKREVQAWIRRFKDQGIPMEQCAIAAGLLQVDPKDILPEIELVQNGYVSMIGYQTKGYAQIPMD